MDNRKTASIGPAILAAVGIFAAYTLVYDLALVVGWSLRTVTLVWLVCAAVISGAMRRAPGEALAAITKALHGWAGWIVLALSATCALAGWLINKPNEDDSFYLSRAVLNWEGWRDTIVVEYPFAFTHGTGGIFTSLPSYEHACASIAALFGVHPLFVYHGVAPALAGAMVPVLWYRCLRRTGLAEPGAAMGVWVLVLLMLLDGVTVRGLANFSLFRMFQGKVILLAAMTPLAITATVAALERGRRGDWALLVLLGVAGMGLSTTAAFFLPVLMGVAAATRWVAITPRSPWWRVPAAALAPFLYPAACVLPLYVYLVGPGAIFATEIARNLEDTLRLVYGTAFAPTPIAAGLALAALLAAGEARTFLWLILWTGCIALPLAWPPTATLIAHYLTSADALWRLAYACPVLLAIGLGAGTLADRRRLRAIMMAILTGGSLATAAAGVLAAPVSPFTAPDVRFPSAADKAPAASLAVAHALIAALPPGRMLAPRTLSFVLPMLTGRLRMTNFREFDAAPQLVLDGQLELAAALNLAHDYVSGLADGDAAQAALTRIAGMGLEYIVLDPAIREPDRATAILTAAGYHDTMAALAGYRAFTHAVRADCAPGRTSC